MEEKRNFPFPYLYYIICRISCFYNECVMVFKRKCGCEVLPHRSKEHLWEWLVTKLSNPVGHMTFCLGEEFSSTIHICQVTSGNTLGLELGKWRKQGANIYMRVSRCLNQKKYNNSGILYVFPFTACRFLPAHTGLMLFAWKWGNCWLLQVAAGAWSETFVLIILLALLRLMFLPP